jgi:hypothetical protein
LIFAHNIFYDLSAAGFFRYFTKAGWEYRFLYDKGLTYLFVCAKGTRSIKAISTTNYFPASLAELGRYVGLPKHPVNPLESSRELRMIYCFRDTEIIVDFVLRYLAFLTEHDLGSFRLTRASQSFAAYRHRFLDSKILVHESAPALELEKLAYMGGRTEAFRIGEISGGPFHTYDVNSMYPYVMMKNEYPCRLTSLRDDVTLARAERLLMHYAMVAECVVATERPMYAVRLDGKVCFPVGTFACYLCSRGIAEALRSGELREIRRAAVYEKAQLFAPYVEYFYSLRERFKRDGNRLYDQYTKLFLNSLYGKFGQTQPIIETLERIETDEYFREEIFDLTTGEIETVTRVMNTLIVTYGSEISKHSLVAIPAHITEDARLHLSRIIERVGWDRVLYCDTDSVKIRERDAPRLESLVSPSQLGLLKLEKRSSTLHVYGLKDYQEDETVRLKGVPRRAVETSPGVFHYDAFLRQVSHMRLRRDDVALLRPVTKVLSREYSKGVVLPTGQVRPYRLSL